MIRKAKRYSIDGSINCTSVSILPSTRDNFASHACITTGTNPMNSCSTWMVMLWQNSSMFSLKGEILWKESDEFNPALQSWTKEDLLQWLESHVPFVHFRIYDLASKTSSDFAAFYSSVIETFLDRRHRYQKNQTVYRELFFPGHLSHRKDSGVLLRVIFFQKTWHQHFFSPSATNSELHSSFLSLSKAIRFKNSFSLWKDGIQNEWHNRMESPGNVTILTDGDRATPEDKTTSLRPPNAAVLNFKKDRASWFCVCSSRKGSKPLM